MTPICTTESTYSGTQRRICDSRARRRRRRLSPLPFTFRLSFSGWEGSCCVCGLQAGNQSSRQPGRSPKQSESGLVLVWGVFPLRPSTVTATVRSRSPGLDPTTDTDKAAWVCGVRVGSPGLDRDLHTRMHSQKAGPGSCVLVTNLRSRSETPRRRGEWGRGCLVRLTTVVTGSKNSELRGYRLVRILYLLSRQSCQILKKKKKV